MIYKESGFRALYHRFVVFMLTDRLKSTVKKFPGAEQADCVLVYGYIDHTAGLSLEVLASGQKDGDRFLFQDGNDEIRSVIRIDAVENDEFYQLDENAGEFKKKYAAKIEMVKYYDASEEIERTRTMEFLDDSRENRFPDDVLVYLIKDGFQVEGCWVRIEGHGVNVVKGILLNEPEQDLGCHALDMICFFVRKMKDGRLICCADLNRDDQ